MSLYEQTVRLHLFLKASDLKDLKLNFNEFFLTIQYFDLKRTFLLKVMNILLPQYNHLFKTLKLK